MYKMEIDEQEQTIYIYLYGRVGDRKLYQLKKELYIAANQCPITDVIFHIKDVKKINRDTFCTLLDDFEDMYGIKVHVLDTVYAIVS